MKNKKNAKNGKMSLLAAAVVAGTVAIPVANAAEAPTLEYQTHVENYGWMDAVNGGVAGTTGKSLRLEALRLHLNDEEVSLNFDVHVENYGWLRGLTESDLIGTTGRSLRMESIVIRANGLLEKGYKLQYRVHVENWGWLDWVDEGQEAGTTGRSLRMEAIEIRVVEDKSLVNEAIENAANELTNFVENSVLKKTVPGSDMDYAAAVSSTIADGYANVNAATTVDEANTALETAKANVVDATREYVQHLLTTVYNSGNAYFDKELTEAKYNDYKEAVAQAETMEDMVASYEAALNDRVDLEAVKAEAVDAFTSYLENSALKRTVPGSDVDYLSALTDEVGAGYGLISAATNSVGVAEALETAKANMLPAAKEYVQHLLDTVFNGGEPYYGKELTEAKYSAYSDGITNATTEEEVIGTYEAALNDRIDLEAVKAEAVDALTNYVENSALKNTVPGSEMDYAAVPDVQAALSDGYRLIDAATNSTGVAEALETAKTGIVNATREYVQFLLETVYNKEVPFGEYELVLTTEQYEAAKAEMDAETTVEDIIATYDAALAGRLTKEDFNLQEAKAKAIAQLNAYVDPADYTINATELEEAITAGETAINESTTILEVSNALDAAKLAIDGINTDAVENRDLETALNAAVTEFSDFYENTINFKDNTVAFYGTSFINIKSVNDTIVSEFNKLVNVSKIADVDTTLAAAKQAVLDATKAVAKDLIDRLYVFGLDKDSDGTNEYLSQSDRDGWKSAVDNITEATTDNLDLVVGCYETTTGMLLETATNPIVSELTSALEASGLDDPIPGGNGENYLSVHEINQAILGLYYIDAETPEEYNAAVEEVKANILAATKSYVLGLLDAAYNNGEPYYGQIMLEETYNNAKTAINEATDWDTAVEVFERSLDNRGDLAAAKTTAKANLRTFVASLTSAGLTQALTTEDANLDAATNMDELRAAIETAEANLLVEVKAAGKAKLDELKDKGFHKADDLSKTYYLQEADYNDLVVKMDKVTNGTDAEALITQAETLSEVI